MTIEGGSPSDERAKQRYRDDSKGHNTLSSYRVVEEFYPLSSDGDIFGSFRVLADMNCDQHRQIKALEAKVEYLINMVEGRA